MAEHGAVEPVLETPIPAVIEVKHDLWLRVEVGVLDTKSSRVQQSRNVIHLVVFASGPQQPAPDLVTNRDYGWLDSRSGEGIGNVSCIVVQAPGQTVDVTWPAGGYGLVCGICPCIAEVKVKVYTKTLGLRTFGDLDVVVQVVVTIGWVNPYALANGIHARLGQCLFEWLSDARGVCVFHTSTFLHLDGAPVNANILQGGGGGGEAQKAKRAERNHDGG